MSSELKSEFKRLLLELMAVPSETREAEILAVLDWMSPDPTYLDYIYSSMEFYDEDDNLDIDRVVEKVFSYQVIRL